MQNKQTIVIRLKDSLDIICHAERVGNNYIVSDAYTFFLSNNKQLVMQNWLPEPLMEEKSVTIKNEDILLTFIPNEIFSEFYEGIVSKMNSVDNPSKESILNMEEALEELDKGVIIN